MEFVVARTLVELWPDSGDFAVIVVAGEFTPKQAGGSMNQKEKIKRGDRL